MTRKKAEELCSSLPISGTGTHGLPLLPIPNNEGIGFLIILI